MPTLRVAGRTDMFAGDAWQAAFAIGCASVVLGVVITAWPDKSVRVSGLLFGLCLLLTALWQLLVAFRAPIRRGLRILEVVTAMLTVLLALWCMQSGDWVPLLALWVGMGWAIHGIVQAIVAVWSDDLPGTSRLEVVGLLTLIIGLVVIVWPIETIAALSVLVGVCLILLGLLDIRTAAHIGRPTVGEQVGVHGLLRSQPGRST
ncbi:DUF308 domain-containing protein [Nocardia transvalensis]|uniref:DUF308 domain-containing protein n=1 Tax=Nocardia transvalensis TaxID=37333 RepID=UPI001893C134|nr:DUF308 domain-containing protein [Nocardia transvalensis]MBF6328115.1 DUF308 domain-containing protein [Nocardia transvalensis]